MFGLLDWAKVLGGAAMGALVAYNVGHWSGRTDGYEAAQVEARTRALALIKKRSQDNEEIGSMDAARLCVELGGKWLRDEGRCD